MINPQSKPDLEAQEWKFSTEDVPDPSLQSKEVDFTEQGTFTVVPNQGFAGIKELTANVDVPLETKSVTFTANGVTTIEPTAPFAGMQSVEVAVDVPLETKSVTFTANGVTEVLPDQGSAGMTRVSVKVDVSGSFIDAQVVEIKAPKDVRAGDVVFGRYDQMATVNTVDTVLQTYVSTFNRRINRIAASQDSKTNPLLVYDIDPVTFDLTPVPVKALDIEERVAITTANISISTTGKYIVVVVNVSDTGIKLYKWVEEHGQYEVLPASNIYPNDGGFAFNEDDTLMVGAVYAYTDLEAETLTRYNISTATGLNNNLLKIASGGGNSFVAIAGRGTGTSTDFIRCTIDPATGAVTDNTKVAYHAISQTSPRKSSRVVMEPNYAVVGSNQNGVRVLYNFYTDYPVVGTGNNFRTGLFSPPESYYAPFVNLCMPVSRLLTLMCSNNAPATLHSTNALGGSQLIATLDQTDTINNVTKLCGERAFMFNCKNSAEVRVLTQTYYADNADGLCDFTYIAKRDAIEGQIVEAYQIPM